MYDHLSRQIRRSQFHHLMLKFSIISAIYSLLTRRTIAFVPMRSTRSPFSKDFGMMSTASISTSLNAEYTLASFLTSTPPESNLYHITLGNEAGDADSIISSLSLSYVNSLSMKDSRITLLPLVSINRDDLPLRRDVMLILEMAGICVETLVYLDDEMFASIANDNSIRKEITLVDHNKLKSDLWNLKDDVVEIIDHHQDEGEHQSVMGELRKIGFDGNAALVGSTCTLISERLMESGKNNDIDAGLGLVLLSVILLDTMNMSGDAGKGTMRDKNAIEFLISHTEWDNLEVGEETREKIYDTQSGPPCRKRLYEYLRDSKFDPEFWKAMRPRDTLRIDYKRFESSSGSNSAFGLASVLLDMNDLLAKNGFYEDAIAYMSEADIDLLGVLTMVIVNDKPQRGLLLVGTVTQVNSMTEFLLHSDAASYLEVTKANDDVELGSGIIAVILKQGNPKGSRKQVAPVMQMKGLEKI